MTLTQIIMQNEGLIYKIANYFKSYNNMEDLYQAGCLAIINAYPNYDETKGSFSTYIYPYIFGEMSKLISSDKPLKVSRELNTLRNKILKVEELLAQKLMRKPTKKELCDFLEITELELAEALNSNIKTQSIENNIGDTNILLEEILADPYTDYDDLLYLKMAIEALEEPERTIMIKRFYEDKTQSEIAKLLGTNQVDVSRHSSKALTKIKVHWHFYPFYL